MHLTVFIGVFLCTAYVTEGLKPMGAPSGFDSKDLENEEMKACFLETVCYLGDEIQKAYVDCGKDVSEEDIDFGRKEAIKIAGTFNTTDRVAMAKEFCDVFTEEQKQEAQNIASTVVSDRIMEKCRVPNKDCEVYKTSANCVAQLLKKNKEEKKC